MILGRWLSIEGWFTMDNPGYGDSCDDSLRATLDGWLMILGWWLSMDDPGLRWLSIDDSW